MKNTLIIFAFIFSFYLNAQKNIEAKELTRKEIRLLKKQKAYYDFFVKRDIKIDLLQPGII